MKSTLLLALLTAVHLLPDSALSLRISAFNIRTFGDSKMSNETIGNIIVQIVSTYDLVLIQEVRDADLSAVKKLMSLLNGVSADKYSYVVSPPLGRSSYKEQYLFIYREGQGSVVDTYLYDDGCEPCGNDTFSREPFVVKFEAPGTEVKELALVPLHTAPSEAVAEIDALYDVYRDVISKWGTHDVLFLGDLNADCSYVRPDDWPHIRLRTSRDFQWLIPDTVDTTVTSTDCAYDRIVAAGPKLRGGTVPGTARVNDFQKTFGLSNKDALAVSDHFPVEVTLKPL
ncbi:PREDICTED: deoxyribonuclease-1-like [Gekko japonicus]|uniref:Deoxyribonuclease n=1 Tax=Gekko japonicus TaxID=146911 RepID=A0ABM1JV83_GEKJA|nr:PREDICTED: deoxyribonuclease-1-like [Gekko japonicus]